MKIIISFAVIFAIILSIKVLSNLKFRKNKKNIILDNHSIKPEFSDDDIPLSQALRGLKN
ncbi:MAG: hypothetical protein HFJ41_01335 [Clostridia bacterium]|nr:hypothetical protein [Clostridia bacterium]